MRKLLTFLIALASIAFAVGSPSFAQMTTLGAGGPKAAAPSTYQGPGDVVSGASSFYSCARVYSAALANPSTSLCDLVDSSAPTIVICTLRGTTSGFVDLSGTYCTGSVTPATKCAAATGGVCNISKAYDQAGTSPVTQATAANQPTLTFSVLNGLPAITATSSQTLVASSVLSVAQPWTAVAVSKRSGNFTTQQAIIWIVNGSTQLSYSTSPNTAFVFAGSSLGNATASDSAFHTLYGSANNSGGGSNMFVDGSGTSVNLAINNGWGISSSVTAIANSMTGQIMEAGIWPVDFNASSRATNMNANQHSSTNGYNF